MGWHGGTAVWSQRSPFGIAPVVKLYVVPYVIFVIWLDLVTFLHHSEADIPWYRGNDLVLSQGGAVNDRS